MSWQAAAYVDTLESGLTRSEKLLMFILADHHNPESGWAWPSISRLSVKAMLTHQHVYRLIKSLESKGFIEVEHNGGRLSNRYRFPGMTPNTKLPPNMDVRGALTSPLQLTDNEPSTDDEGKPNWREWWEDVSAGLGLPTVLALTNPASYFRQAGDPPPRINRQHWRSFIHLIDAGRRDYLKTNPFHPLTIPVPGLVKALLPVADGVWETDGNLGRIVAGMKAVEPHMPDWSDALVTIAYNPSDFNAAVAAWKPDTTPAEERETTFG